MLASVELQVISKLLVDDNAEEVDKLLSFDSNYYSIYTKQIQFIQDHYSRYGNVPDVFTFQAEFPDVELVRVDEPIEFLVTGLNKNRQRILLIETFNKIDELDSDDVSDAWKYIGQQYDKACELEESKPMNIIQQAKERSDQVLSYSKQKRIPTGFPEIDKLMYGGLSTVEELLVVIARMNSGKSWLCTKMMESAQANGFPVLYYSPEMQSSLLATRFDTWREHFRNNELFTGKYSEEYLEYIEHLPEDTTPAFIVEDKDMPDGVSVRSLTPIVKRFGIKLLIIDGLSYMKDDEKYSRDSDKYKHICAGLFNMSKQYGCAVVVTMQANRATLDSRDENGEPFPTIYNAEGSDHPARIATQVFAMRQIFETKTLDIRMEKSRNAANTKPVLSYVWEVNTGHAQFVSDGDNPDASEPAPSATFDRSAIQLSQDNAPLESLSAIDDDIDEDVTF